MEIISTINLSSWQVGRKETDMINRRGRFTSKTLCVILGFSLLFPACVKHNVVTTPDPETIPQVIPTPATYAEIVQYLQGIPDERITAMDMIHKVPAYETEETMTLITENLFYDEIYEVRSAAAITLGELGERAYSSVPSLILALQTDKNVTVQCEVADALGKLKAKEAIPALASLLYSTDIYVSALVAQSIANITGEPFRDSGKAYFTINDSGQPLIVIDAITWWEEKGQYQEWNE
jgi:hypothetical protein